jgi:hypothetical protein
MKVFHIVATATLSGFAFLGWMINYGEHYSAKIHKNRKMITEVMTKVAELEAMVKGLEVDIRSSAFPQPSKPSSSECAFDTVDGVCTSLDLESNLQVTEKDSATQGNDNVDQTKSDSDAPDLQIKKVAG